METEKETEFIESAGCRHHRERSTTLTSPKVKQQLIDQMFNLDDLWRAAGSPEGKSPRDWIRGPGKQVIEDLARELGVEPSDLVITIDQSIN